MKNNAKIDNFIGCLCALGCEILFGLSYIFTRKVTRTVSPFALLGWRFFTALILMSLCIVLGVVKVSLKGKSLKQVLLAAFFNPCIYFIGETLGISHTTASESGVILASIPVVSLIVSTLILKKKPLKTQVIGIGITLAGVVITVFAVGLASSLSFVGYLFLFFAVVSYALYSVYVEKTDEYTSAEITYIMLIFGAVLFGIIGMGEALSDGTIGELLLLPFADGAFAAAVLYQGVGCSIIAFFLSNTAIAKIGVNRTASFIGVSTVVSTLAGAFLLKETFTVFQIAGAVVIIVGVYVANIGKMHGTREKNEYL